MISSQLRVSKETVVRTDTVLDTAFEQPAEKDFVLPDYCPDVFHMLRCRLTPRVTSQSISGGKLTVDTEAVIRVMYLSEGSGRINLLEHKLTFSKTLDLGDCTAPTVKAVPRLDYVNCRVVNQRRVDVRGAYTVKICVTAESRRSFVTGAVGAGIQLRQQTAVYPAKRLTASKRITVVEELELGGAKPPVGAVLRSECRINRSEQRVVSGKLITKGEASVELLYIPADSESTAVETMSFGLPFSQIIDVEGLDESFEVRLDTVSACCEVMPRADDGSRLECELVMLVNCTAVRYESCEAVTDAFSTQYECTVEQSDISLGEQPGPVCAEFTSEGTLTCSDGEIASVASVWCEAGNITLREGRTVSGSLNFSAIGQNAEGSAVWLENEIPFEFTCDSPMSSDTSVTVRSCTYRLGEGGAVEVRAVLAAEGSVCGSSFVPLADITVDTDKPLEKAGSCAVKLCSVSAGEELWELARRCRTSVEAIKEENGLSSDKTETGGMLLIPLIN